MARFTGTSPSALYADFLLDISVKSQNISNNTTTLEYRLFFKSKSGGYPYTSTAYALNFKYDNTTVISKSTAFNVPQGGEYTLHSGEFTVTHSSDGTKTISLVGSMNTHHGMCNLSASMLLPTIVRSSTFTIPSSVYVGNTITANVTKGASNFTHYLTIAIGAGETYFNYNETTGIGSFSTPMSWINEYFKNNTSLNATVKLYTYNGGSLLGTDTKTITVRVPESIVPQITNFSITEQNSTVNSIFGNFRKGISDLRATVSTIIAYESNIANYKITVDGTVVNSSTNLINLPKINKTGTVTVSLTVTDSRGRSASTSTNITINDYNPVNISLFSANRKDNAEECEARVILTQTISGSPNKNPMNIKIYKRESETESFTQVYSAINNATTYNNTVFLGSDFDIYKSYEIKISITDVFSNAHAVFLIPTSDISIVFDATNNNVGIGHFPREIGKDSLDVKGTIICRDDEVVVFGDFFNLPATMAIKNKALIASDNLSNIYEPGFYSIRSSLGRPNNSSPYAGLLTLLADGTDDPAFQTDGIQIYVDKNNEFFVRNSIDNSAGTWNAWEKLGTKITKYTNGFLIEHQKGFVEQIVSYDLSSTESAFTTGSAGFYGAKTITVNLHKEFATDLPHAVANCYSSGFVHGFVGQVFKNRIVVRLYSPNSTTVSSGKIVIYACGY